jgi:hypothetical protein
VKIVFRLNDWLGGDLRWWLIIFGGLGQREVVRWTLEGTEMKRKIGERRDETAVGSVVQMEAILCFEFLGRTVE